MTLPLRPVSASELAKMARCERQLLFDLEHGSRLPPARTVAVQRGHRAHVRHDQDVRAHHTQPAPPVPKLPTRRWCFIATVVYGEASHKTVLLRQFRDHVLRHAVLGRFIIQRYYRYAPALAAWLRPRPRLARIIARRLDYLVIWIARQLDRHRK